MTLDAGQRIVPEESTFLYTAYVRDENGVVIASASLASLVMTLWVVKSGTNIRAATSMLNANGGTMHASSGLFSWAGTTVDTTLEDTTLGEGELEEHRWELTWTYGSPTKTGKHKDSFFVSSLLKTT